MSIPNKQKIISANNLIIAENEQKVYDAGYEKGKAEGGDTEAAYEQGVADGKQAEYDAFWDSYQYAINGISQISSGAYMFAHSGWNDSTFKPKYSMTYLTNAGNMFNTCAVTDLSAALERQGVVFDFSKCTNFVGAFSYAKLTRVPVISTLGTTPTSPFNSMFYGSNQLHTIEKLILKSDGSQIFNGTFTNCAALENIVIEGVIGQNGFNMQWSTKLSRESIESIINALSDTTSGLSITLSLVAVNRAFAYVENGDDGSINQPWLDLVASKPNWAINLV